MADLFQNQLSAKIPFNDAVGSTTFQDLSNNAISFLRYGEVSIVAGEGKWYPNSAYFDGVGDGLYLASAGLWAFTTVDWCVEAWVKPTPDSGAWRCIASTIRNEGNAAPGGAAIGGAGLGGWGGAGDEGNGGTASTPGGSGIFGVGGNGSTASNVTSNGGGGGGGGGGGYYGGGGGCGSGGWWGTSGGGGGGGSNYVSPLFSTPVSLRGSVTITEPAGTTSTGHVGNGHARITRVSDSFVTNFTFTGAVQSFVPPTDDHYLVEVWGAQGGNAAVSGVTEGGRGGYCSGIKNMLTTETYYVFVGGQNGYNGGGTGGASVSETGKVGGGATDVRTLQADLTTRIIVAGGGGGCGGVGSNGYNGVKTAGIGGAAGENGIAGGGPAHGFGIFIDNVSQCFWAVVRFSDGTTTFLREVADPLDTTVFNHVALVRNGPTLSLYRNGIQTGQASVGSKSVTINTSNFLYVGCYRDDEGSKVNGMRASFKGNMNDLRITLGNARYTSNFTPPVSFFLSFSVSGRVIGPENTPVSRVIRLYSRATGAFIAETTSDPTTGAYTIITVDPGEHYAVALDDADGTLLNDIIIRAIPVEIL